MIVRIFFIILNKGCSIDKVAISGYISYLHPVSHFVNIINPDGNPLLLSRVYWFTLKVGSQFFSCDRSSTFVQDVLNSICIVNFVVQPLICYSVLSTRCYKQFNLAQLANVSAITWSNTQHELSALDPVLCLPFTPLPTASPPLKGVIVLFMQIGNYFTTVWYSEQLPLFRVALLKVTCRLQGIVG